MLQPLPPLSPVLLVEIRMGNHVVATTRQLHRLVWARLPHGAGAALFTCHDYFELLSKESVEWNGLYLSYPGKIKWQQNASRCHWFDRFGLNMFQSNCRDAILPLVSMEMVGEVHIGKFSAVVLH